MPTTSKGFRYPASSVAPNIPQDIQNAVTDINTYLDGVATAIAPAAGWTNLAGFAQLQGFRLGNFCVIYGTVTNSNAYSAAQTSVSVSVPTAMRPAKSVMVHGGVQIGTTAALQSCRFDILPGGGITVSPNTTISAGAFHAFTAVYNVNNV